MSRRPAFSRFDFSRKDARKRTKSVKPSSRRLNHETLEKRELLAAEVLAIRPDAGALISEGARLDTAPREFNVFFNGTANLDPATIEGNVRLVRAGGDGMFDDNRDVDVALGYLGFEQPGLDTPENRAKLVLRPASTAINNATDPSVSMPDDFYRIEVSAGLLDGAGEAVSEFSTIFQLDRAAQVLSVVPQPIGRTSGSGTLEHLTKQIDIYFDDQPLNPLDAETEEFYQLYDATTGEKTSFIFEANYEEEENRVQLTFVSDIPEGNYRLDIGNSLGTPEVELDSNLIGTPVGTSLGTSQNLDSLVATGGVYRVSSQIEPQSIALPQFPGGLDTPGHRSISAQNHFKPDGNVGPGFVPLSPLLGSDFVAPADTVAEKIVRYGFPPQFLPNDAGVFENFITAEQREITRGIIEIYSQLSGYEFVEDSANPDLILGRGDLRAADPAVPTGTGGTAGLGGPTIVVLDFEDFDAISTFGDGFTGTMFHEVGHALGLGHVYDLHATMGFDPVSDVNPGDPDIEHLKRIAPPVSTDIDVYRFELLTRGTVQVETFAERLATPSQLNSKLRLFRQEGGRAVEIAGNLNYFGADAFMDLVLDPGEYFVGVSSAGNEQYDPIVENSGFGGTTFGEYDLQITFVPEATDSQQLRDVQGTGLDGDQDGQAGGVHSFWFQASDASNTVYVDRLTGTDAGSGATGSVTSPFRTIDEALLEAASRDDRIAIPDLTVNSELDGQVIEIQQGTSTESFELGVDIVLTANDAMTVASQLASGINAVLSGAALAAGSVLSIDGKVSLTGAPGLSLLPNLVRIVGDAVDAGVAGQNDTVKPIADLTPYLVGIDGNTGDILEDGAQFRVPRNTTVMIDAGVLLKMRAANIDVGTVSSTDADRSGGALQLLGTPNAPVFLRSYYDDSAGGESDGNDTSTEASGDFGGIVFRNDSDLEDRGIFLNHVNHADIRHGGGEVVVNSVPDVFAPINMIDSRPTISFNTITAAADVAMQATPDSFEDSIIRVGPDIDGNFLQGNGTNGLLVDVDVDPTGLVLEKLTVAGRFDDTDITHVIEESLIIQGSPGGLVTIAGVDTARPSGSLVIEPGTVIKLDSSRIQTERGAANLIAEGTEDEPIIFTSVLDARYGAGGTFDLNRGPGVVGSPGDWAGIVFSEGTTGSIDHSVISYGGGDAETPSVDGGLADYNAIEIHQAGVRIANTLISNNADGGNALGGVNALRGGTGINDTATIYVRGAQPTLIANQIVDNEGAAISIDVNSLRHEFQVDPGRQTGLNGQFSDLDANRGPLIRFNELDNNAINGLELRTPPRTSVPDTPSSYNISTEVVWDDTDIVHVVTGDLITGNLHTFGALKLYSSVSESLVVKMQAGSGFTASGTPLDMVDRIGGTIHVIGQPGYPVVITDINDDDVGAGFSPRGEVVVDTNNNGASTGVSGSWDGFLFDEFSNDRNVAIVTEIEPTLTAENDRNNLITGTSAQNLGVLAPDMKSGDENRRLGFEILGFISPDAPNDVDTYSFSATGGTEVFFDIDQTASDLDAVIELKDNLGNVLASSVNATTLGQSAQALSPNVTLGGDFYTLNHKDPGMRVSLPGAGVGEYFIQVSSEGGLTSGGYRMQIRMQQVDEFPGSTIRHADIRYATTAIDVEGLPTNSPLTGDAVEVGDAGGEVGGGAQNLINLLESDAAALSIAGEIGSATDVDVYAFEVNHVGNTSPDGETIAVVFDLDYADQVSGLDATIAVFNSANELIYLGRESNIEDDRPAAGTPDGRNLDDLSRGSVGDRDPYIGPIHLPTTGGTYYVAVMSDQMLPVAAAVQFFSPGTDAARLTRLEPVNSVTRIVEDHIGFTGYTSRLDDPGTLLSEEVRVLPTTPAIFDISDATTIVADHTPALTFDDLNLFLATDFTGGSTPQNGDEFYIFNPNSGDRRQHLTSGGDTLRGGANDVQDIVVRSDGAMFGYTRLVGNAGSVGQVVAINGAGNVGTAVNDNISGANNVGTIAANVGSGSAAAQREQRALQLTHSDEVDALTFYRSGTATAGIDSPQYDSFLVVRESPTSSKLYRGRANGDAEPNAATSGTVYGAMGYIQPTGVMHEDLFFSVRDAPPATGATPEAEIRIRAKTPGDGQRFSLNLSAPSDNPTLDISFTGASRTINIALATTDAGVVTSTAADIVNAINNATDAADNLITGNQFSALIYSGNAAGGDGDGDVVGVTVVGGLASRTSTGGSDDATSPALRGRVTGIAFGDMFDTFDQTTGAGNTLFGVTSGGELITINPLNGQATLLLDVQTIDPTVSFTGLALGPQNSDAGIYQNMLFAVTNGGELYAFNPDGTQAFVFNDGVDATLALPTGGAGFTGSPVGLAFSPFDFNLWHPTLNRGGDDGHGVDEAPDNSRTPSREHFIPGLQNGGDSTVPEGQGGVSFYFGLENWTDANNSGDDKYINPGGGNSQVGLSEDLHRDLSSNPDIGNNYNLPGGAKGTLLSGTFDLDGSTPEDRPTLYFNYFLDTRSETGGTDPDAGENSNDGTPDFTDSARVFVRSTESPDWVMIATNNQAFSNEGAGIDAELDEHISHLSNPGDTLTAAEQLVETRQTVQLLHDNSGLWRQARIDLSTFAGDTGLQLRFDFSTDGVSIEGTLPGDEFGGGNEGGEDFGAANNAGEGFYIDDIIVGYTERGEMVTNAPAITGADAFTNLAGSDATNFANSSLSRQAQLDGDYQLEIRRTDLGDVFLNGANNVNPGATAIGGGSEFAPGFVGGGDFAVAYDRVSEIFIAQTFDTNARHVVESGGTNLLADDNRNRPQGLFLVENNVIADSSVLGIHVQPGGTDGEGGGVTYPGPLQNFEIEDTTALIPGVVIRNNVLVGSSGIDFDGPAAGTQQGRPYGRILNNTFVGTGGGVGIDVNTNASPIILNNVFAALGSGIQSGGADAGLEIENNLFVNSVGGNRGDNPIVVAADSLFDEGLPADARAARNFYLAANPAALDASEDADERTLFIQFKQLLGIPASPVDAPSFDALGQVRTNSGGATAGVIDLGAVDRADRRDPFASLLNPLDNLDLDTSPIPTVVQLDSPISAAFSILLSDGEDPQSKFQGTGIDPTTVNPDSVVIRQNNRVLTEGEDFTLAFNASSGELRLTPLSELWEPDSVYEIILFNRQHQLVSINVENGAGLVDGNTATISNGTDSATYEFDAGHVLQLVTPLSLNLDAISVGADVIGETFSLTDAALNGGDPVVFNLVATGSPASATGIDVAIDPAADSAAIAAALIAAIRDPANTIDVDDGTGTVVATPVVDAYDVNPVVVPTADPSVVSIKLNANGTQSFSTTIGGAAVVGEATSVADGQIFSYSTPDADNGGAGTEGYTARFRVDVVDDINIAGNKIGNLADDLFFDDELSDDNFTLEVADKSLFTVGDFIRIDDELMIVTDVSDDADGRETIASTISVRRGILGTAVAPHLSTFTTATTTSTSSLASILPDAPAARTAVITVDSVGDLGLDAATDYAIERVYIQINDEIVRVTAVDLMGNVTVERAALGTPRADHLSGDEMTRLTVDFTGDIEILNLGRRAVFDSIDGGGNLIALQPDRLGLDEDALPLHIVRVNDEIMLVEVNAGAITVVERGYLGTAVGIHAKGDIIEVIDTSRATTMVESQSVVVAFDDMGDTDPANDVTTTVTGTSLLQSDHVLAVNSGDDFQPVIGDLLQIGTGDDVEIVKITDIDSVSSPGTSFLTLDRGMYDTEIIEHSTTMMIDVAGVPTEVPTPVWLIDSGLQSILIYESDSIDDVVTPSGVNGIADQVRRGVATKIADALRDFRADDLNDLDLRLPRAQAIEGGRVYLGGSIGDSMNLSIGLVSEFGATVVSEPGVNAGNVAIPFIPSESFPQSAIINGLLEQINNDATLGIEAFTEGDGGFYLVGREGSGVSTGGITFSGTGIAPTTSTIEPIRDFADNPIRPTEGNGNQTRFTIGVGTGAGQYDFGDGATNDARHTVLRGDDAVSDPRLGSIDDGLGFVVDVEPALTPSLAADGDDDASAQTELIILDLQEGFTRTTTQFEVNLDPNVPADLAVLDAFRARINSFITIGEEIVQLLSIDTPDPDNAPVNHVFTVVRGQNGTPATAHGTGASTTFVSIIDDEEGIDLSSVYATFNVDRIEAGAPVELTVLATGYGALEGWIDFDGDGTFTPDERIFNQVAVWPGDNVLPVNLPDTLTPDTLTPGDLVMRLRISERGGLGAGGIGIGGEVEDHVITIIGGVAPTLMDLVDRATADDQTETFTTTEDAAGGATPAATGTIFTASMDEDGDTISVLEIVDLRTGRGYPVVGGEAVIEELTDSLGRVAGRLVVGSDSTVTFTPRANYDTSPLAGPDGLPGTTDDLQPELTFGYRLVDSTNVAGLETGTVTLTVEAENQAPTLDPIVTVDDSGDPLFTLEEDDTTTQTVNLAGISAGTDDVQPLRITVATTNLNTVAAADDLIILDGDEYDDTDGFLLSYDSGSSTADFTFTTTANQYGQAEIVVTITDPGDDGDFTTATDNLTTTETITVTVNPVNDDPTAFDRQYQQTELLDGVLPQISFTITPDNLLNGTDAQATGETAGMGSLTPGVISPAIAGFDDDDLVDPFDESDQALRISKFIFGDNVRYFYERTDTTGGVPTTVLIDDPSSRELDFRSLQDNTATLGTVETFSDITVEFYTGNVQDGIATNDGELIGTMIVSHNGAGEFVSATFTPLEDFNDTFQNVPIEFDYELEDDGTARLPDDSANQVFVDDPATTGVNESIPVPATSTATVRFSILGSPDTPVISEFNSNLNRDETDQPTGVGLPTGYLIGLDELFDSDGPDPTSGAFSAIGGFLVSGPPNPAAPAQAGWITISEIDSDPGTPGVQDPNPAGLMLSTPVVVPSVLGDPTSPAAGIGFIPTPDAYGVAEYLVTLTNSVDITDDGIDNPVPFTTNRTITFTVNPVNDAPEVANQTITTTEGNLVTWDADTVINAAATQGSGFAASLNALYDESEQTVGITSVTHRGSIFTATTLPVTDPGAQTTATGGRVQFVFTGGILDSVVYQPNGDISFATAADAEAAGELFTFTLSDGGNTTLNGPNTALPLDASASTTTTIDDVRSVTATAVLFATDVNDDPIIPLDPDNPGQTLLDIPASLIEDQPRLADGSVRLDIFPGASRILPGPITSPPGGPGDESSETIASIELVFTSGANLFDPMETPTLSPTGQLVLHPVPDASGTATFDVIIQDSRFAVGMGGETIHTGFTVNIGEINDKPVTSDRSFITEEDTLLPITAADLLAIGTSTEALPARGSIDPAFNEASQTNLEVAEIRVQDSNGIVRTFRGEPGAPTSVTTVNGGLLELTFEDSTQGNAPTGVTQRRFASANYTPGPNYNGTTPFFNLTDNFDYVVRDSGDSPLSVGGLPTDDNLSVARTARISVTPVNDAPNLPAFDVSQIFVNEVEVGTTAAQTANVYSVNPDTRITAGPASARDELFTQNNLSVVFTPINVPAGLMQAGTGTGFAGGMRLPTMGRDGRVQVFAAPNAFGDAIYTIQVDDGQATNNLSGLQLLTISVNAINDAPTALDRGPVDLNEGATETFAAADLLAGALASDLPAPIPGSVYDESAQTRRVFGIGLPSAADSNLNDPTPVAFVDETGQVVAPTTGANFAVPSGGGNPQLTRAVPTANGELLVTFERIGTGRPFISSVAYTPDADYNNLTDGAPTDAFTYFIEDSGELAIPGSETTATLTAGVVTTSTVAPRSTIDHGSLPSEPARVTLNVLPVNSPPVLPVFVATALATEDTPTSTETITVGGVSRVRNVYEITDLFGAGNSINAGSGPDEAGQTLDIRLEPSSAADAALAASLFGPDLDNLSLSADGTLTMYVVDNGFGTVEFDVSVADFDSFGNQLGLSQTETLTITVASVNDAPVSFPRTFSFDEPIGIGPDSFDIPVAGLLGTGADAAMVNGFIATTPGPFDESTQSVRVAAIGLPGSSTPSFSASDPAGTGVATWSAPSGGLQTRVETLTTEDGQLEITFERLSNATDDNSTARVASLEYTPDEGFSSSAMNPNDQFTYFVQDFTPGTPVTIEANNLSVPNLVSVTVNDQNDAPMIPAFNGGNNYAFTEDTAPFSVDILDGADEIVPGDVGETATERVDIDVVGVSGDLNMFDGDVTLLADGTLSFTPVANATGSAVFRVDVTDERIDGTALPGSTTVSAPSLITLTINPVNDAPFAGNQTFGGITELADNSVTPTEGNGQLTIAASELIAVSRGSVHEGDFAETDDLRVVAIGQPGSTLGAATQAAAQSFDVGEVSKEVTIALGSGTYAAALRITFVRDSGATASPAGGDPTARVGEVRYTPHPDFNNRTAFFGPNHRFTFFVQDTVPAGTSGAPLASNAGTVTLDVQPADDLPSFDGDGLVINLTEQLTETTVTRPVVTDFTAGPETAIDETGALVFRVLTTSPNDGSGLLASPLRFSLNGDLTINYDAFASGTLNIDAEVVDGAVSTPFSFTINVAPVNNRPVPVTDVLEGDFNVQSVSGYRAVGDGSLDLIMAEDNLELQNDIPDLFTGAIREGFRDLDPDQDRRTLPLLIRVGTPTGEAFTGVPGLLDLFDPGPVDGLNDANNDEDDQLKVLGQFGTLINGARQTDLGGTLIRQSVATAGGQTEDLIMYFPPNDLNSSNDIPDSFRFNVLDDENPALSEEGTVRLFIRALNDAPEFTFNEAFDTDVDPAIEDIVVTVSEDAASLASFNLVSDVSAGPVTAVDELDVNNGQTVSFTVTPDTTVDAGGTTVALTPAELAVAFTTAPAVSPNGNLTFQAAPNVSGTFTFNLVAKDNDRPGPLENPDTSGTEKNVNISASQPFTIVITGDNDSPILRSGEDNVVAFPTAVTEDIPAMNIDLGTLLTDPFIGGSGDEVDQVLTVATGLPTTAGDSVTTFRGGSLMLQTDGNYSYTPPVDYNGPDSLVYTVTDDGTPDSPDVTATLTFDISAVNDVPVLNSLANVPVDEDSGVVVATDWFDGVTVANPTAFDEIASQDFISGAADIQFNATDIIAEAELIFAGPQVNPITGDLTFQINPDVTGLVTYDVQVTDSAGAVSSTQFTIQILSDNDAPTFTFAGFTDPATGLRTDLSFDPNDSLTFEEGSPAYTDSTWFTSASAGTNEVQATQFVITSSTNSDLFTTQPTITPAGQLDFEIATEASGQSVITIVLQDDNGTGDFTQGASSIPQTLTINVTPVADDAVAMDDSGPLYSGSEDSILTFAISDIFANDIDADGDAPVLFQNPVLSFNGFTPVTPTDVLIGFNSTTGIVSFDAANSPTIQALDEGDVEDFTFTYQLANDDGSAGSIGTVTVSISGLNDVPVAVNDNIGIALVPDTVNGGFVGQSIETIFDNDFDPDADDNPINRAGFLAVLSPEFGSVGINHGTGELFYTPGPNFSGEDMFRYTLGNEPGSQPGPPATVRIVTTPTVDGPGNTIQSTASVSTNGVVNLADEIVSGAALDFSSINITSAPVTPGTPDSWNHFYGDVTIDETTGEIIYTPSRTTATQRDAAILAEQNALAAAQADFDNGVTTVAPDPTAPEFDGRISDLVTFTINDVNGVESDPITIEFITAESPLHNAVTPRDVNVSGEVTPLDALLIINVLNDFGGSVSITNPSLPTGFFFDVNDDGTVSAVDALQVINGLNSDNPNLVPGPEPLAPAPTSTNGATFSSRLAAGEPVASIIADESKVAGGMIDGQDDLLDLIAADQAEGDSNSDESDSLNQNLDAAINDLF